LESMMILGGIKQSYISYDNARTWDAVQWNNDFIPMDVSFPGDVSYSGNSVGYAVGTGFAGGVALKTSDGGRPWEELELPAGVSSLKCCYFVNSIKGMIAGEEGGVYTTSDGGQTWVDCSLFVGDTVSDVILGQNGIGWAAISKKSSPGHGSVYFTKDSGKTWGGELSGHKSLVRLYSDRPGRVAGVGHVPKSNSDLVVLYESVPSKEFIKAKAERSEIEDITPVIPEVEEPDVLKPVVKSVEVKLSVEYDVNAEREESAPEKSDIGLADEIVAPQSQSEAAVETAVEAEVVEEVPAGVVAGGEGDRFSGLKRFFRRMFMFESDPEFKEK